MEGPIPVKINRNEPQNIVNHPNINAASPGKNIPHGEKETSLGDKITISDKAREYSAKSVFSEKAAAGVKRAASSERLLALRSAVMSGKYDIESEKIAGALLGIKKS